MFVMPMSLPQMTRMFGRSWAATWLAFAITATNAVMIREDVSESHVYFSFSSA